MVLRKRDSVLLIKHSILHKKIVKEKAGEPARNLVILVCFVRELVPCAREDRGLLEGASRELVGLSQCGSSGKKTSEENKAIGTKTSLKAVEVVYVRKDGSLN